MKAIKQIRLYLSHKVLWALQKQKSLLRTNFYYAVTRLVLTEHCWFFISFYHTRFAVLTLEICVIQKSWIQLLVNCRENWIWMSASHLVPMACTTQAQAVAGYDFPVDCLFSVEIEASGFTVGREIDCRQCRTGSISTKWPLQASHVAVEGHKTSGQHPVVPLFWETISFWL